jgi:nucleotide-binding universal stress UspA family protein
MTAKPIVVGYDGSKTSKDALQWALDAARRRQTTVRLVHAVPPGVGISPQFGGYTYPDRATLERAAAEVLAIGAADAAMYAPEVTVDTRLVSATPAAALLTDSAADDLIVVGSRGLGGFAELLVGSTGVELAAHANCPVVVIRPGISEGTADGPGTDVGRIVVGVDGSVVSAEAMGFAFEEAASRGLGLTALHAWQSAYFDSPGKGAPIPGSVIANEFQGSEMRLLAESVALWTTKFPAVDLIRRVMHGDPVTELVKASAGATMVVVGSRGRDGFRSLLLGSVSHAVLHHAHCPVVVVRHTS